MSDQDRDDLGHVPYTGLTRRNFAALAAASAAVGVAGGAHAQALTVTERDVDIRTADGVADAALFSPEGNGRYPGVLVWPDAGSLRPAMRDIGRRLAGQGYVVLVANAHYRGGRAPTLVGAANAEKRAEARKTVTDDAIDRDARAFVAYLDRLPQTSNAKVGVQGYCMGGPLSFRTAAAVPNRIGAVGSFHGGGLTTTNPNSPHLLIEKTNARFLVAVAKNDDANEPTSKTILRETFNKTGRPAVVDVYGGNHGWCVPDNAQYMQSEAERAWAELSSIYRASLV